jgi:hypothetical protein
MASTLVENSSATAAQSSVGLWGGVSYVSFADDTSTDVGLYVTSKQKDSCPSVDCTGLNIKKHARTNALGTRTISVDCGANCEQGNQAGKKSGESHVVWICFGGYSIVWQSDVFVVYIP